MIYQVQNSIHLKHIDQKQYKNCVFPAHIHKSFEYIYVMEGCCSVCIDNKKKIINKNFCALILPNQIHSFLVDENSMIFVCVFSSDYINSFSHYFSNKICENYSFECSDILTNMMNQEIHSHSNNLYIQKSLFNRICGEYITDNNIIERKASSDLLMYKIILYISENYKSNISLFDCAKDLNYEPHYISKYFNNTAGIGFTVLLNNYRIENAKELLLDNNLNITNIAMKCGYKTIRNFNYAFKKATGITPKQYREDSLKCTKNITENKRNL